MTEKRADLRAGEQLLVLNGTEYILRPTFQAALTVSSIFGGFVPLGERLTSIDLAAMSSVLIAGAGITGAKNIEKAQQDIFQHGELGETAMVLIEFLGTLSNGGKPRPVRTEPDEGNPPQADEATSAA